jgi:hypothetical protein
VTRRGRGPKSLPAGRAIGWWIAGFEERMYPERETVQERVRWGTETRISSGPGSDAVVRFPDDAGPPVAEGEPAPAARGESAPAARPVGDPGGKVESRDHEEPAAERP